LFLQNVVFSVSAQNEENNFKLISVKRIWDKAPHNAFTDLMWYNGKFWCVFREGSGHVSPDGALRVISSVNGENWEPAALITSPDSDLRDAKITVTPDGKFMLSGAEALHDKSIHTHQSLVWFSDDGVNWSEKHKIGDPDFWLWRTTWHKNEAFNFGYGCGEKKLLRLYKSSDGKNFETLVEDLNIDSYPNETSVVFKGDTAFCLLRRDGENKSGLFGIALPPYKNWEWKDMGVRIGGPDLIILPDGRFLAAVRLYETDNWHPARTSLCQINPATGKLSELLTFPSGGDTSYAGMVWHDDVLWVSYYSSHEEKTAIYLAKVQIGE
jgi:hypothetical protein